MGRFIESAQRRVRSIWMGRALSALLFLGLCAPHALAQTPAGTVITSTADAAYDDENGNSYTALSNTVSVTVGQVAGVDIEPPRSSIADPGNTVAFPHTIDNMGNGLDSMNIVATSQMGWTVRIYEDVNGDAVLDAGDVLVNGPVTLAMGATANLLVAVYVPSTPTVRGSIDSIDVQVTSMFNASEADGLSDELQIRDVGVLVNLSKSVDRASGTTGDVLTYTVAYNATGPNSAANLQIIDPIPVGTSYVPGTMQVNSNALTDANGDDEGFFDVANNRVEFALGTIAGGGSGTISFQARIVVDVSSPQTMVSNTASSTYETIAGTDAVGSNTAQTSIVYPQLVITKDVTSATVARIGEELQYTIRYGNVSPTAAAENVTLTDSLPAGLEFVSAQPAGRVSGQVITWNLGDVAPGDSVQVLLTVRASQSVQDTLRVQNVAVVEALNAPIEWAVAEEVALVGVNSSQLSLEKAADVLEVGLGETVPYTLRIENTGLVSVTDLRIHDRLPAGARYATESAIGADSIAVNGRDLTMYVAGPLAPGATHTIRYAIAIISADAEVLSNVAYATAENEFVRSEEAIAWIRVRRAAPMETRTAFGKVWIDADADGVQDFGEAGLAGVDIWTDDGEIVTTDNDGKFSFNNLRPGRHGFRLDASTVPAEYRIAGERMAEDLVVLGADGWTSPRINFRVLPATAQVARTYLPIAWTMITESLCDPADYVESATSGDHQSVNGNGTAHTNGHGTVELIETTVDTTPLVLQGVQFEYARSRLTEESYLMLNEVAESLASHPNVRVEITGHSDATGSLAFNNRLSLARAKSVMAFLAARGVAPTRMTAVGLGPARPIATNQTEAGRAQNRRVELHPIMDEQNGAEAAELRKDLRTVLTKSDALVIEPAETKKPIDPCVRWFQSVGSASSDSSIVRPLRIDVTISNPYKTPIGGLSIRYATPVDSVVVLDGKDTLMYRGTDERIKLSALQPGAAITIRNWAVMAPDSSIITVEQEGGRRDGLRSGALLVAAESLPASSAVAVGDEITLVLTPQRVSWPVVRYTTPAGWEYVLASSRAGDESIEDPSLMHNQLGAQVLAWHLADRQVAPIELRLRPSGMTDAKQTVRVAPLRTDDEREADKRRAFIAGPAPAIFEPVDGTVFRSDRVYVGVRGEPGAPVSLYDGDSLVAEAQLRIDGVHDFIAIPLSRGPHHLRLRMKNSWSQERWDSVAIHITGLPTSFDVPDADVRLSANSQDVQQIRARVLDQWGIPVVSAPFVTVEAQGAEPAGQDADPSSVGHQVRTDATGWVTVPLRAGVDVGPGKLVLLAGTARTEIGFDVLPAIRPFMLTGIGQVGLGASPDAMASLTARGRLNRKTSIVLSYDSRNLDAGQDFFGRGYDPLEESRYPIIGDASRARVVSSSRHMFSARVERGYDWFALGDLATNDFASGLSLTNYRRSLTGVGARVTTGPAVWQAFGSFTRQSIQTEQIRGAGISGPYQLQPDMVPGTERIVLETRSAENAQRIVTRQALARFIDYQIDYERGTLLFKRPVVATDVYDNPVFIMVTYEARRGGERRMVGGVRAALDAAELLRSSTLDSLRIGATSIRSDEPDGAHYLNGADVRIMRFGAIDVGAEFSFSNTPDSSGFATAIDGGIQLLDAALQMRAGWMKIGEGFANPSNAGLRAGTEELKLGAGYTIGTREIAVRHERQSFDEQGVTRSRTSAGIMQRIGQQFQVDALGTADEFTSDASNDASQAGELKVSWNVKPNLKFWSEGRRQFSYSGTELRPNHVGAGVAYKMGQLATLEARHRRVFPTGGSPYSVTNVGLRSDVGFNTQVWGSYQLAGVADGAYNAAIVGLNNRVTLGSMLTFNTLFERRVGLDRAPLADPIRALPFLQTEDDYWSFGLGMEVLPQNKPYRMSARGELRNGDLMSSRLVTMAGDVSINRSFAVLSRQEFMRTEQFQLGDDRNESRRLSSLWGVAFRPTGNDKLNMLTKFSWLSERNPAVGALTQLGDEKRMIGATELIWAPQRSFEIAGRYAMRRTVADRVHEDGMEQRLESWADYVGMRVRQEIAPWIAFRSEGRLLIERASGSQRWDLAPSIAVLPLNQLEIAAGYRFGDLQDPDFAVRGGHGWFVTFGARLTEQTLSSVADFWRDKL